MLALWNAGIRTKTILSLIAKSSFVKSKAFSVGLLESEQCRQVGDQHYQIGFFSLTAEENTFHD